CEAHAPTKIPPTTHNNQTDACESPPRRALQEGVRVDGRYRASIEAPGAAVVCLRARKDGACERFELKPEPVIAPPSAREHLYALVDDRLSTLVTLGARAGSPEVKITRYALPEGRKLREFQVALEARSASLFTMLEDHLYIRDCVGAGPGCSGRLHPPGPAGGAPFAVSVREDDPRDSGLNVYGGSEIQVAPGLWAFVSASGHQVVWMDFAKRRARRHVQISELIPGIASSEDYPWLEENADPGAGNFAYKKGEALHIVYGLHDRPPGGPGHWRVRLHLKTGALIDRGRVPLCPSS
ncbi:MAG: hypothetical protein RIF32_22830, partial [Leptospirales bacterium]